MNTILCRATMIAVFAITSHMTNAIETARIAVAVVDDDQRPVVNATVGMGISDGTGQKAAGVTDLNGLFSARLRMGSSLYVRAEKQGYYKSSGYPWSGPSSAGMVPPVNVYTVVLKRIVNPVAMTNRLVKLNFPKLGEFTPLDLAIGDWVAPHGKGLRTDVMVLGEKNIQDNRHWAFQCMWQFTNGDGVVRHQHANASSLELHSSLTPPQALPNADLTNRYVISDAFQAGKGRNSSDGVNDHLLFRVRTVTNEQGLVLSAQVGWINGAVVIEGRETDTMWMQFDYYYNPDPHSRSLEPEEIAKRQVGP